MHGGHFVFICDSFSLAPCVCVSDCLYDILKSCMLWSSNTYVYQIISNNNDNNDNHIKYSTIARNSYKSIPHLQFDCGRCG